MGVAVAERHIDQAKPRCEVVNRISKEEVLKKCQEYYYQMVEKLGENALNSINAGADLAVALYRVYHVIKAERLHTKLL